MVVVVLVVGGLHSQLQYLLGRALSGCLAWTSDPVTSAIPKCDQIERIWMPSKPMLTA